MASELVLPFVDPGELRLDLPVGAGGLSNIRRVRDSTDERLAVLQKSADGSTWTDVGEVTIPEPDPRILRRIAVRTADDQFTASDFTGTLGTTSYSRSMQLPTLGAITNAYIGFAVPMTSVAGEYFSVDGDLTDGTALSGLRAIEFGLTSSFTTNWLGNAINATPTTLTIDGRPSRVYTSYASQAVIFFSGGIFRLPLTWLSIPA